MILHALPRFLVTAAAALFVAALLATAFPGDFPNAKSSVGDTEIVPPEERIFCPIPAAVNLSRESCLQHDCLWDPRGGRIPSCYLTRDAFGYVLVGEIIENRKHTYNLYYYGKKKSPYFQNVINFAKLEVTFVNENIIRFKLTDQKNKRYEVPIQDKFNLINNLPPIENDLQYQFHTMRTKNGYFAFKVTRASNGQTLFDTTIGNIILTNYFLQISTRVPTKNVYGFGENVHDTLKHNFDYETWPIFSRDNGPNALYTNLYGAHPYYQCVEDDAKAHGVFLLNSNAIEYTTIPAPGISFNTIGGVLDFILFVGDNPEHVTKLYHEVIGRTILPPYWSLGFHLSKFGYFNSSNLKAAIDRTRNAGFPQDVQHLDIDYMDSYLDFTYDQKNFAGLPEYIKEKQKEGLKFITMLDPAIIANASRPDPYPKTFVEGATKKVFIQWDPQIKKEDRKNPDNADDSYDIMYGHVWPPGPVAFPDFFKKSAVQWWEDQISFFRNKNNMSFDAIWIDMNEPSEFATNPWPVTLCGDRLPDSTCWRLHCPKNEYDDPEYPTAAATFYGYGNRLPDRTLCMVAVQGENNEYHHFDVHNLYGHTEGVATKLAAQHLTQKRSLVLSRSTYPSSGHHMGHWLGDNNSQWTHLRQSIIGMLEFNMFGIPYVGADICGFAGPTTEELCTRWFQLGAYYPFSRNHNIFDSPDQDPGVFSTEAQAVMRQAMLDRYKLIPYLYTLFYRSHTEGGTVVKPLFHEYPKDKNTYTIDQQFMWGSSFLINPILFSEQKTLKYYVPEDTWYDFHTCKYLPSKGERRTLDNIVANTSIPVLVRGGSIIPTQEVKYNTQERFNNPMDLYIYGNNGAASGELFWDDGDSIDTVEKGEYELYKFSYDQCKLNLKLVHSNKRPSQIRVRNVVLCSSFVPNLLLVDGVPVPHIHSNGNELTLKVDVNFNMFSSEKNRITIEWSKDGTCDI